MRNIYEVFATQVVTSLSHPEGILSAVPDSQELIDSRNYPAKDGNPNGDSDTALIVAQAKFSDVVKTLTLANNPSRVMWCVTLTQANGVQIARKTWGSMPDMTPAPTPTPTPETTPEGEAK